MVGHILKCKYVNKLVELYEQAKHLRRLHNLRMFICLRISREWRSRYKKLGVSGIAGIQLRRARMALSLATVATHASIYSRALEVVEQYLTYSFQMG